MKISLNWIKDFVNLPSTLEIEKLVDRLILSTTEVEKVIYQGKDLDKIILGQVKKISQHPNADKLSLAEVDFGGTDVAKVVCGGTNLKEGMKVAFALPGAFVRWHGEGELQELKPAKIRGEESFGMICSSDEIGLPKSEGATEIFDLSEKTERLGTPIAEIFDLNDIILEIENKSINHRPDLWGHYGLAREVAALFDLPLKDSSLLTTDLPEIRSEKKLQVKVSDYSLCRRFSSVMVDNIKIKPSPVWLQSRLTACGLRPINNIVDITNYVMLEFGNPLHAYDRNLISGDCLNVQSAVKGDVFIALDGKEYQLKEGDVVISDQNKKIGLAGILGGQNSEISPNTSSIIIEVANFNPVNIRRTSMRLGLKTDAALRFEKSLDPNMTMLVLKRTLSLLKQSCPDCYCSSEIVDNQQFTQFLGPIKISHRELEKKIGVKLEPDFVFKILTSLGFGVTVDKNFYIVNIPTWRATKDISIKDDLIEEVARIYGYDNIEIKMPVVDLIPPKINLERQLVRSIKNILIDSGGFCEAINYSFSSEKLNQEAGIKESGILLKNPPAMNEPFLRVSGVPLMLQNLASNFLLVDDLRLMEVERNFSLESSEFFVDNKKKKKLPNQDYFLTAAISRLPEKNKTFFLLKAIILNALTKLGYDVSLDCVADDFLNKNEWVNKQEFVFLTVNQEKIGVVATLSRKVSDNFDLIGRDTAIVEINLNKLLRQEKKNAKYQEISKFPSATRDLAIVFPKNVFWVEIEKEIKKTVGCDLEKVDFFDEYQGASICTGKKSLAFHLSFSSKEKTLSDAEVDALIEKIKGNLKTKFNGVLRQ